MSWRNQFLPALRKGRTCDLCLNPSLVCFVQNSAEAATFGRDCFRTQSDHGWNGVPRRSVQGAEGVLRQGENRRRSAGHPEGIRTCCSHRKLSPTVGLLSCFCRPPPQFTAVGERTGLGAASRESAQRKVCRRHQRRRPARCDVRHGFRSGRIRGTLPARGEDSSSRCRDERHLLVYLCQHYKLLTVQVYDSQSVHRLRS